MKRFAIVSARLSSRASAVFLVVVAAFAAGAGSVHGAAVSQHRAPTHLLQDAESPSWSPDGKQIVFTYFRYAKTKQGLLAPSRYRIVRTSSKPGGAIHTVHAGRKGVLPYSSMRWTANGRIVFSVPAQLLSVSVHGGKPRGLVFPSCLEARDPDPPFHSCYPAAFILSPDREIAAVTTSTFDPNDAGGIALAKVNAAKPAVLPTPLTAEEQQSLILDLPLAFSPDGRQLVFSRTPWDTTPDVPTGPAVLMALPLSGGGPVPLAQSGIPGAGLVPDDAGQVQWSPDGAWVAFAENQSVEVVTTTGGSPPRALATCPGSDLVSDLSWSPTSKVIAFDCYSHVNGSARVSTVRPDGTHLTDLLKGHSLAYVLQAETEGGPQWSPDGSRLLLLAHRIGHRTVHVWTIRPNGTHLTQLG